MTDATSVPISLPCAGEVIYKGYLYKNTSGNMTAIDGKADTALVVAVETSWDIKLGQAKAKVAGEEANFYPLGCGKIVPVACVVSQTLNIGAPLYLDDSVNGQATAANSTSTMIGHYMGRQQGLVTVAGQLVPCLLDVKIGGA
ncbi:MAG TPA: hypothetical protein VN455_01425 [Methanotrichaceae archaeon]|nr:hypothetical protein [Methanotrichaceae archaeon]